LFACLHSGHRSRCLCLLIFCRCLRLLGCCSHDLTRLKLAADGVHGLGLNVLLDALRNAPEQTQSMERTAQGAGEPWASYVSASGLSP
jgi:hypothetical protein